MVGKHKVTKIRREPCEVAKIERYEILNRKGRLECIAKPDT